MTDINAEVPGINPELITKYFNHPDREFGLKQLITVFDYLRRATLRAEDLSQAYLNQIVKLQRQKAENPDNPIANIKPNTSGTTTKSAKPKILPSPHLDLNLDL